jgi:hypothetical protein
MLHPRMKAVHRRELMSRSFQMIVMGVICITGSTGQAFFEPLDCKKVNGHFRAVIVPPGEGHCPSEPTAFCTAGRVWGGIQGDYQFVMSGMEPSILIGGLPTIFFFTGKSTILLKRGDQLLGSDTGTIDLPPGEGGFASLITFTGGTGDMSSASGQIRLRGEFDAAEETTAGDYRGTVCKP